MYQQAFARAAQAQHAAPVVERFPDDCVIHVLASACRELQRQAGTAPFMLSTRTISRGLGISPWAASHKLWLLRDAGFIKRDQQGTQEQGPSLYRYLLPLDSEAITLETL